MIHDPWDRGLSSFNFIINDNEYIAVNWQEISDIYIEISYTI